MFIDHSVDPYMGRSPIGEDHIMDSFKTVPQSLPKSTDDNEKPPLR
jgi:hypothetical protein